MKKLFVTVIAVFIFTSTSFSDNLFLTPPFIPVMTSGAPITVGLRYPGGAGYSRSDSAWVYVSGGLQDGNVITNTVYRYNVLADSWSTLTNFPDGNFWISASTVLGNKLYSLGGTYTLALNECTPRVKIYNLVTNTWSSGANMPYGRVFHSVCAYQDSLLYCAGGWGFPGGTVYNDVYLYNANNDTWRPATNMPAPRSGGVLAVTGDTLVYVCGGPEWFNPAARNTVFRGRINQSDRTSIIWDSAGTVYPGGVRNSIYGASWGNKGIIVSGGFQISTATNQCYVYSPGANVWTVQPNLLSTKTDHAAASINIGNIWKFLSISGTSNRSGTNSNTVNILTDTMSAITGINNSGNQIPITFNLEQNYPNPFNPSTKIRFDISGTSVAQTYLYVYDILGQEIATLVNDQLKPGTYEVTFEGTNCTSGVYFYKLISTDYSETKRMILIK